MHTTSAHPHPVPTRVPTWARCLAPLIAAASVCVAMPGSALAQAVAWTQRSPTGAPSARYGHAMAFDASRGETVLFGGITAGNSFPDDTWLWSNGGWSHRPPGGGISGRIYHAMAYDSARGRPVLYGGQTNNTTFTDTWEWLGLGWTDRTLVGGAPGYRALHAMAYDSARGVTVAFGGGWGGYTAETWEWNGTVWTRRFVAGPSARGQHAMAYDSARGVTVLFGGNNGGSETWEWDGTTWTQRMVSGPSTRVSTAMAYDSARGVTVLFGGFIPSTGTSLGDTWEWNGTAWTQVPGVGPSARYLHAMAYDSSQGMIVLFGGLAAGALNAETSELCVGASITSQPSSQDRCPSDSVAFSVTAAGSGPFTYQWLKGGVPIDTIANPSAATATLTISSVQVGDAGSYNCMVTNSCGSFASDAAALAVASLPFVSQQPTDSAICPTGTSSFSASASGTGPLTFRWQWQPAGTGGAWVDLAAGDNAEVGGTPVLNAANVATATLEARPLAGYINFAPRALRCVVTNSCGNATSNQATLAVCPADFDCDGTPDFFDYDAFVICFEGGTCPPGKTADFDADGTVDFFDYDAFVVAFEAGC